MAEQLAIAGGSPVKSDAYPAWPYFDAKDEAILLEALRGSGRHWGRFDVRLTGTRMAFRVIATMMNLRSRLTGIATGDQGIFVTRALFETAGRFPDIALMEDIALCKTLKAFGGPLALRHRIVASGRRWEKHGVLRTILLMWRLRLQYWLGANPDTLAKIYVPHKL